MSKRLMHFFALTALLSLFAGIANAADITPQLYVTFDGSLSGSNYVAGPGEIINGTVSLKNGTEVLDGGILTTAGGQEGLHFMPTDSLAGKNGEDEDITTTNFVIEGIGRLNAAISTNLQTFFCVQGSVGYRYNPVTATQYWTHGPTSTGWAVVNGVGQPVSDTDMVHYALVYEYVSETECKLSYYVDAVQFGDTLVNTTAAGGTAAWGMMFAAEPHPSGADRGMPLDMDMIAFSTFTGTFDPDTDFVLPEGPGSPNAASAPQPRDGEIADPMSTTLRWNPGDFAVAHDVYFGSVFEDVNDASRDNPLGVLVSQAQNVNSFDPGRIEYSQTYYWRIDEVNGAPDNTIFKGDVWSFTTEPFAYPIENVVATSNGAPQSGAVPERLVDGSGLNENDEHSADSADMWLAKPVGDEPLTIAFEFDQVYKLHEMLIWNYNVAVELLLGFGAKDVTIEYSENGADWAVLGDVVFNQGTTKSDYTANTTVDLGGVAAQYVKITVNGAYGALGQYGLSEVRFLYIPVQAREPQPADGAVDMAPDTDLTWRAGREAVSHEVYLSTDPEVLERIDTTSATTVDPGALELGATYYWRIDEVNETQAISTWAGAVWSFSTEAYIVVEDFESYTDDIEAGEAIFLAWIDGYEINDNGSTVGHLEAPFAETTIVHGGGQSMPLFFDNAGGVTVSEAERTLDVPMDWTAHGIKSLSLAFAGDAANVVGQLYLKVNGVKVVYGGAADDLEVSGWLAWTIDISALGNVSNVTTLAIGVEGAGASGVVYIDDIRLYPQEVEMVEPAEPDPAGLMVHYLLDNDFQDSSGNGNHGQVVGDAAIANDPTRGGIASLDGLGDGIQVPAIGDGTAAEATISLWMNTDIAWTSGFFSLYHNDGWAAGDIHMHVSDPGTFSAGVNGLSGGDLRSATAPEVDEWYNITVTVSPSEASLYVNGVQEDLRIPTAAPESFIFGEGHLGIWLNGANLERALTGQIDDVRFYNRVLSYGEAMGLAGRTTSLYKPF